MEYSNYAGGIVEEPPVAVGPGTLIVVTDQCSLRWRCETDLVVLTPTFEQTGIFAVAFVSIFAFFALLLVAATQSH